MTDDIELAEQEQELPEEIAEKKKKGTLKTGYTTGTTATVATKAALLALITGKPADKVTVSLPKNKTATLAIAWTRPEGDGVTCAAIKDGGDDPDVTHGAEICSTVSFGGVAGQISVDGGRGVGRVTKPGLGLEIGRAAINSTPMSMLVQAVKETAPEQLKTQGIQVVISVPKGEELAKKTDKAPLLK